MIDLATLEILQCGTEVVRRPFQLSGGFNKIITYSPGLPITYIYYSFHLRVNGGGIEQQLEEEEDAAMASAAAKPILYSYWFSSCAHRVRIALNLKGVDYEYRAVNPMTDPDYEKINPIKYVPALLDGDFVVSDSFAIILYLEDKYPQHLLLPQDLRKKALNLQIASIVCSSIQPLQSHAITGSVLGTMDANESLQMAQHYIDKGFRAIEKVLEGRDSKYATGDEVQMGDVFLAAQIHAGLTLFQIDMSKYPILARLQEAYTKHPAFEAALPQNQWFDICGDPALDPPQQSDPHQPEEGGELVEPHFCATCCSFFTD